MSRLMNLELMEQICDHLLSGKSMREIAKIDGMPSDDTVYRFIQKDEQAHEMYTKAKAIQGERIQEEIDEVLNKPLPVDP